MEQSPLFWIFNIIVVLLACALTVYSARTRKGSGGYLCEDCRFNNPQSCLKSVRPLALVCTSYRPEEKVTAQLTASNANQSIVLQEEAPVSTTTIPHQSTEIADDVI
jgi:hypothetical protein